MEGDALCKGVIFIWKFQAQKLLVSMMLDKSASRPKGVLAIFKIE